MSISPTTLTQNHTYSSSIPQEAFLEEHEGKVSSLSRRDVEPKLSTSYIFDKIRPLVCSIGSTIGESSGFFINHEGTILTVAHNIPEEKADERVQFTTDYVQIDYGIQGTPYFSQPSDGIVQGHAKVLDLYSMESKIQLSESSVVPILPEDIQLQEGMKVYFAGYPLSQDTVTFHKGTISSITEDQGIKRFTIDGTVVPGNSGGPVVIQYKGHVYLVGVITSEVADFSPEDQKTIAIMKALSEIKRKQPQASHSNAITLDQHGVTVPIQITTSQGVETVLVNDRDITCLALDLIQRNLSTGIGKAIDIRHYRHLFQEEPRLQEIDRYSFPVGKGKKLISNTVGETDGEKRTFAKYMEVRYGNKGRGNRGIHIMLCPALGKGPLNYKFSPNPHTAQGNYNKNQEELYKEAALNVVRHLMSQKQAPKSFTFNACQATYSAILE